MRIYAESSEETLRARKLLRQWSGDGSLSKEQGQRLEQDTVADLRTTNIFLRLVLFFFTLIATGAAVGLFFTVFLPRQSQPTTGVFLLIFATVSYAGAEAVVARARLYRYGIEEALTVCAVAFLCVGLNFLVLDGMSHSARGIEVVIPAVGAMASLWIWYRFNLWYAFVAAMIFGVFLPGSWTASLSAQHVWIAVLYGAGWMVVARLRSGHRFDALEEVYSLSEAFLCLGIYLALNLKISDAGWPSNWLSPAQPAMHFARPFYWVTWVLTWCVPPLILVRGVRLKDRLILAVGAMTAVLTLVTNKPYLGWERHSWDPILLGIALAGAALLLRRLLVSGPGGVRYDFTAARLFAEDQQAMSVSSSILGLVTPQSIMPSPQPANPEFGFGGGESGGGGAGGDF